MCDIAGDGNYYYHYHVASISDNGIGLSFPILFELNQKKNLTGGKIRRYAERILGYKPDLRQWQALTKDNKLVVDTFYGITFADENGRTYHMSEVKDRHVTYIMDDDKLFTLPTRQGICVVATKPSEDEVF
jgi:hypothetical protein